MENRITSTTESEIYQSEMKLTLDQLVQRGAQRMLEAALEAEVDSYIQLWGRFKSSTPIYTSNTAKLNKKLLLTSDCSQKPLPFRQNTLNQAKCLNLVEWRGNKS